MIKRTIAFASVVLICFAGCKSKKETAEQFRKEPPKLNQTPNELQNLESGLRKKSELVKKDHKNASSAKVRNAELADMSVGELWKVYKECRTRADKAKEQGNFGESIDLMIKGADAAIRLERPGIASWQYNNAAKHAIDYFKAETQYSTRMKKMNAMKHGDDKIAYKKESKSVIKDKFTILKDAESYLNEAKKYNEAESDPKRVSAIESNMRFVKEIVSFIE